MKYVLDASVAAYRVLRNPLMPKALRLRPAGSVCQDADFREQRNRVKGGAWGGHPGRAERQPTLGIPASLPTLTTAPDLWSHACLAPRSCSSFP
jgi:hypothetical protein